MLLKAESSLNKVNQFKPLRDAFPRSDEVYSRERGERKDEGVASLSLRREHHAPRRRQLGRQQQRCSGGPDLGLNQIRDISLCMGGTIK